MLSNIKLAFNNASAYTKRKFTEAREATARFYNETLVPAGNKAVNFTKEKATNVSNAVTKLYREKVAPIGKKITESVKSKVADLVELSMHDRFKAMAVKFMIGLTAMLVFVFSVFKIITGHLGKQAAKKTAEEAATKKAAEDEVVSKAAEVAAAEKVAEEAAIRKESEAADAKKAAEEAAIRKAAEDAAKKVVEDAAIKKAADEVLAKKSAEEAAAKKATAPKTLPSQPKQAKNPNGFFKRPVTRAEHAQHRKEVIARINAGTAFLPRRPGQG